MRTLQHTTVEPEHYHRGTDSEFISSTLSIAPAAAQVQGPLAPREGRS